MPFFRYSATDPAGKTLQGTIQAKTQDDAQAALTQRGFKSLQFGEAAKLPAQVTTPPAMVINTPAAPAPLTKHRTIIGRDNDRFFIFVQLASALKAGINPAAAFHDVSNRCKAYYKTSLLDLENVATEGGDLAAVMEAYPDLYPEHVAGMTRAGQYGGFLQDTFDEIGRQAQEAHKYKRWFFWIWFVILNALLAIPGMIYSMQGLVQSWKNIDATGGEGGVAAAAPLIMKAFGQRLLWPDGPMMVAIWLIFWAISRSFGSRLGRRFRHKIGLKIPPYGKRARYENLTRFSWVMSRLSKAGMPPARAWQMSAEAVPNLEMRAMLNEVAGKLSGAEKLSDIIHGARLFPDEYASMVATAEYTGDMPGIMQKLSDQSRGEMQTAEAYSKARTGVWGCLGCFATSAAMLGIFWYFMYYVLMPTILGGLQPQ